MARLKKEWFFDSPPNATGTKFNSKNIPTSQVYRSLLDSIPFIAEIEDRAKRTEQGVVKLYTYNSFINSQGYIDWESKDIEDKGSQPPPSTDYFTRVVQASQIPAIETYNGYELLPVTGWEHEAKEGGIHFKIVEKKNSDGDKVRYNIQMSLSFEHINAGSLPNDEDLNLILHKSGEVGPTSLKVITPKTLKTYIQESNSALWEIVGGLLKPVNANQDVGDIKDLHINGKFFMPANVISASTVNSILIKDGTASGEVKEISFLDFVDLLPSGSSPTMLWEIDGDQLRPTTNGIIMKDLGSMNFHPAEINLAMQRGSLSFPNNLNIRGSSGDGGGRVRIYGGGTNSANKAGDVVIEGGQSFGAGDNGDVVIRGGGSSGSSQKGVVSLGTQDGHKVNLEGPTYAKGSDIVTTQPAYVFVAINSEMEIDAIPYTTFKSMINDDGGAAPDGGGSEGASAGEGSSAEGEASAGGTAVEVPSTSK